MRNSFEASFDDFYFSKQHKGLLMEEYRLTDSSGKTMLYAANTARNAVELATSDGYMIVSVEKYEIGYWESVSSNLWG